MEVIKFDGEKAGDDGESTLQWREIVDKDELLVEVFTSEELFKDLSMYWKELEKNSDCKVYMSYEWAFNWWKHFGRNKQRSLFLVTLWDGTRLVGLAPFYKGYSKFGNRILETRLQLIGSGGSPNEQLGYMDDYGISDFLDIIVDGDYTDVVADRLVDLMSPEFMSADVIKFHQAGDEGFIMKHLYPRLEKKFSNVTLQQTDTCPYIDISKYESLKAYIKDQKSNARRRLRQTKRAMDSGKEYEIEDATHNWEKVKEATENIIQLHQNRWNRLGFPGVFHDERFTRFFKDTIKYAFDNYWLWFKQAKDREGVCASRMVIHYKGQFYDYISGFDDTSPSSKYRPGIGLLVDLIEEGIGNVDRVELLRGEEDYKYDFTSENFVNWKLTIPIRKQAPNVSLMINRVGAYLYKYYVRESRLLHIQRQKRGLFKMLWGYLAFRWKSLKMKLHS